MEIYNISSDYVMARPECTDLRARYDLLSDVHSPCGDKRVIDQLESYDFVAERKRLKSPDLVSDKQTAQWAFAASSPL